FLSTTFSSAGAIAFLRPRVQFVARVAERWGAWQAARAQAKVLRNIETKKEKTLKKQTIVTEKPKHIEEVGEHITEEPRQPRREAVVAGFSPRVIASSKRKSSSTAASTEFPSTALLRAPSATISIDENEVRERARLLEEKAREFLVEGTISQIHPGPVVTTFEFKPEPGVKYSRIISLGDD